MSTAELNTGFFLDDTEQESAPLPGADFLYPDNVIEFPLPKQPAEVRDVLLDRSDESAERPSLTNVAGLKDYMQSLLEGQRNRYRRGGIAADYAADFHAELDIDEAELSEQQSSTLMMARLYLSNVGSLGKLDQFIVTGRNYGRKSAEFEAAKVDYLAARKVLQDDIDRYFDHFEGKYEEIQLLESLMDIGNMARLTLNEHLWINAEGDTHTHIFLGSILSERLVKLSLKDNVHPQARYGTEEEDKSPTKADVVFPIKGGDMYVQVKMRWKRKTDLKVQPKKTPPHVIVPMQSMRANLTEDEHTKIAEIITSAAEKKVRDLQFQEALALSGLKKYVAIFKVPAEQLKEWWQETKEVISNPEMEVPQLATD